MSRFSPLVSKGSISTCTRKSQWRSARRHWGLTPQLLDVRKVEDIAPAFADASSQHVDVLIVSVDALTQKNRSFITQLAAGPAIYVSKEYIDAGGLIAYGPHYPDLYRRAAIYVAKFFAALVLPVFL